MPGTESIFTGGDGEMNHRGPWPTRSTEPGWGNGYGGLCQAGSKALWACGIDYSHFQLNLAVEERGLFIMMINTY